LETHTPYQVTEYSKKKLHDYTGPLKNGVSQFATELSQIKGDLSEADLGALTILYEGKVLQTDHYVGQILSCLEKSSLMQNTIIVITADHGELLGEKGSFFHGPEIWEPAVRVPFIIKDPRYPLSMKIAERVHMVDFTPTILDLLGIPIPDGLHGRSIANAVRGGAIESKIYHSINCGSDEEFYSKEPWPLTITVYSGRYKLILSPDGEEKLFDLEADPFKKYPLIPSSSSSLEKKYAEMIKYGKNIRSTTGKNAINRELDSETLEELKTLGYIN
jgi:arylsulfatase A-like enzyme